MYKTNDKLCALSNQINTTLLMFGFLKVNKAWNGTVFAPSYSRLYYITDGKASITLPDEKEIILEKNNWYLLPSGVSFDFNCQKEMEHIYFHLKICSFEGIDLLYNCKNPISLERTELDPLELSEYLDSTDPLSAIFVRQFIEKIIFQILDKENIRLEAKKFSPYVANAISYINDNLSLQLSTNEILENTYVSKSTLTKHFKKELGMSVHQYIFDKIMFESEQLLKQGKMSISQISDKFKFYDQFYFSKCFKKRYGISPIEYRKTKLL